MRQPTIESIIPSPSDEEFREVYNRYKNEVVTEEISMRFLSDLAAVPNDGLWGSLLIIKFVAGMPLTTEERDYIKDRGGVWKFRAFNYEPYAVVTTTYGVIGKLRLDHQADARYAQL